jgi:hypothetical protein
VLNPSADGRSLGNGGLRPRADSARRGEFTLAEAYACEDALRRL